MLHSSLAYMQLNETSPTVISNISNWTEIPWLSHKIDQVVRTYPPYITYQPVLRHCDRIVIWLDLTYCGSAGAARGSWMTLLHIILSSTSVSSSPVISTPVSINVRLSNVALGRPLCLCTHRQASRESLWTVVALNRCIIPILNIYR